MDTSSLIIAAIIVLFCILCLTIVFLITYSGLFYSIEINYGQPPIKDLSFMYKVGQGPYHNSTHIFAEAAAIAPHLESIGVYFDDPNLVFEKNLKWLAGSVLKGDLDKATEKLFVENGFKDCIISKIEKCVWTSFPFTFSFSIPIAIFRVYPAMVSYLKDKNLEAHPIVEIYAKDHIHFLAITEDRQQFYIPEIKKINDSSRLSSDDDGDIKINSDEEIDDVSKTKCVSLVASNAMENSELDRECSNATFSAASLSNASVYNELEDIMVATSLRDKSNNPQIELVTPTNQVDINGASTANVSRKSSQDSDIINDYEVMEEISPDTVEDNLL